jgi:hypothetical protein
VPQYIYDEDGRPVAEIVGYDADGFPMIVEADDNHPLGVEIDYTTRAALRRAARRETCKDRRRTATVAVED